MLLTRFFTLSACAIVAATSIAAATPASGTAASAARAVSPVSNVVAPARIHVANTRLGKILVDTGGRTMYRFAADSPGVSRCGGICLTYWPPVPAGTAPGTHPAGVGAVLGVVVRHGGFRQLTINRWPVYRYLGDSKPGQITGQGLYASGGRWWILTPLGKPILRTH